MEKKTLSAQYYGITPNAVLQLTNTFGVVIWIIDDANVVMAWNDGKGYYGHRVHKVYENPKGQKYIRSGYDRFYLSDFIWV